MRYRGEARRWTIACLGLFVAALAFAQSGGRLEDTKKSALAYLDSNQYDRAAAKFEEVWSQDQSDPSVAENLAIAYMNGQDRELRPELVDKAQEMMEAALKQGGAASFLVQHSHEKLGWLKGKVITDYCSGRLSISNGKLVYVAQARMGIKAHSFDITTNDIKVVIGPDSLGSFTIKTQDKKDNNYVMIPKSRVPADGGVIVTLLNRNLTVR